MKFLEQIQGWEVIIFLVCLGFIGAQVWQKMDVENMLKKESPSPVHMGGKVAPSGQLNGVKLVKIPREVYESLERDTQFKRYLTGNHKYVLTFTYPGCPYSRAFDRTLRRLFEEQDFNQYYRKRIVKVGRSVSVSCPGHQDMKCATAWVYENCFGGLCIFNPQRKLAVVDTSQNAQQLEALLSKYREW